MNPKLDEKRYLYSAEHRDEEELSRLRLQESIIDPSTIRHLKAIGVSKDWRCLEVGAGAGSITNWLLQQVGLAGTVVVTDVDTRFLQWLNNNSNLEIRCHDILKDELEQGVYDLVHCRKLLHHLSDPEKAVQKMGAAVRPGGWILLEEDDFGSTLSADVTDPAATEYTSAMRALCDSLRNRGIADYYIGRRVRDFVEALGFIDVSQDGWTLMVRGGDPMAQFYEMSASTIQSLVTQEVITQEQYNTLFRALLDPDFNRPEYTIFSAWGRKPS